MTRLLLPISVLISRIFLKFPRNGFSVADRRFVPFPFVIGHKFYSQESDKNVISSPIGEVNVPDVAFHEYVCSNFSVWEWRTAIKCGRTGRKYTYRNLRAHSKSLAAWLQNKMNLSKGDTILVVLPNCPEYPIILLATSMIGVIMSPVNPGHTAYELQKYIAQIQAKVIITYVNAYEKCKEAVDDLKVVCPTVLVRVEGEQLPQGSVDLLEAFDAGHSSTLKPVDVKPGDTLIIPFSSGTTGNPKGVVLSHRNLVSNLTQLCHPETSIFIAPTLFHRSSVLCVLPMFHIFGMTVATFFTIKEGGLLVILPSFRAEEFVKIMYRRKISIVFTVPTLMTFLSRPEIKPRYMKHLEYLVNGASSYSIKDVSKILEKSEHIKIAQGYGMTETSPVLAHTSTKRMQKLLSIGIPIASTKLKVINMETGESLPTNKQGELCAFGPQVMKEYYKMPVESRKIFDEKGWLRTGDLAYYDEDGDFYIVDRLKELIKVLGYQVAPSELEETLRLHPKIQDAAVIGVPHDRFGEVPRAYVIPKEKGDLTEREVQKFIAQKHTKYKHLTGGVVFLDEFPRNTSGKIDRAELKKKS